MRLEIQLPAPSEQLAVDSITDVTGVKQGNELSHMTFAAAAVPACGRRAFPAAGLRCAAATLLCQVRLQ
jgi:hypothetical protein